MSTEVLVFTSDVPAARQSVAGVGGRVVHVLTPHLLVIALPGDVPIDQVRSVSARLPDTLDRRERRIADAWTIRLGPSSDPAARLAARAAAPMLPWTAVGKAPPHERLPDVDDVRFVPALFPPVLRRPTSSFLQGSVAVGVVVVGGPPAPPFWMPVAGSLKYVSVASDGAIWGVNNLDQIFRRDAGRWTRVDGALKQISVGSQRAVWGVNAAGAIFHLVGSDWHRIGGELKHVSVGADGAVWGVNSDDEIFRREGDHWHQVAGELKQVSVANVDTVWGVNAGDEIFFREGDHWHQVAGALKYVSAADDGSVWGVNSDDEILHRVGDHWEQLSGRLQQVSVASAQLAWGVNSSNRIYTHDPSLGMAFTALEEDHIVAEVLEGLAFLASAEPSAEVSFSEVM